MKKLSLLIFCTFAFSSFSQANFIDAMSPLAKAKSWVPYGNTGFADEASHGTGIAISSAGVPYVEYIQDGDDLDVMTLKNGRWVSLNLDRASGGYAASLALDKQGNPYVAFLGGSDGGLKAVSILKYDGSQWTPVGDPIQNAQANILSQLPLVIDNQGVPYIAVVAANNFNVDEISVMKFDGAQWVLVGKTIAGGFFEYSGFSLAVDSNGTPYLAYDQGNDAYPELVTLMKFNGTDWQQDGDNLSFAHHTQSINYQLAFDSKNAPYIAYEDNATYGPGPTGYHAYISVSKLDPQTQKWMPVGQPDFAQESLAWESFVISLTDTPFVVFQTAGDMSTPTDLNVMMLNKNNKWIRVGNPSDVGKSYPSPYNSPCQFFTVDKNNIPYVLYNDASISGLTVKKLGN